MTGASSATGTSLFTFTNQLDNVTSQLNVRFAPASPWPLYLSHSHVSLRLGFRIVTSLIYGDQGMNPGSCPNRAESSLMSTTSKSLVLMNYFRTDPSLTNACTDNSDLLLSMLKTCHDLSANRWANFVALVMINFDHHCSLPIGISLATAWLWRGKKKRRKRRKKKEKEGEEEREPWDGVAL
ncbi:hypothetical protein BHE74_00046795 [Ensete ventricosum]|nr:hypothetical protein BHE74_00046795 [Ensete ventricosum]